MRLRPFPCPFAPLARAWVGAVGAALFFATLTAAAAESLAPREVLARAIEPVIDILSWDPPGANRCLALHATVTESSVQPPELIGQHVSLYLQPADRAYFQFLSLGSEITVCRQGQTIWMAPTEKLAPLLQQVAAHPPTRADKEPIAPVRLKVPATLFWLLFRLVPVKDAGHGDLNGVACRKVDVRPPDSEDKNGYMRLWMRADNSMLARLEWHGSNSHATITVDDLKFSPTLPPDAFDPASVPLATRLPVPADRFRPLMTLIEKLEDERRKQLLAAQGKPPAGGGR